MSQQSMANRRFLQLDLFLSSSSFFQKRCTQPIFQELFFHLGWAGIFSLSSDLVCCKNILKNLCTPFSNIQVKLGCSYRAKLLFTSKAVQSTVMPNLYLFHFYHFYELRQCLATALKPVCTCNCNNAKCGSGSNSGPKCFFAPTLNIVHLIPPQC